MSGRSKPGRDSLRGLARAGLASAFLLNGGCMTSPGQWARNGFKVGPNYQRPPAPVAEDWIDAKRPGVQKRQIDEWWHVFQDPKLDWLIETAYRQSPNLR